MTLTRPPVESSDQPVRRNVLLLMAFDGTDFVGLQQQPGLRSVQGVMEEALQRMLGHPITLRASSRTDSGVHARGLPANFETNVVIPAAGIMLGVNALLPDDLAVIEARDVPLSLRCRDAALAKTYRYRFQVGISRRPLLARTSWWVRRRDLDVDAMNEAAAHFLGRHDFSSFRARGCQSRTTTRLMHELAVTRAPDDPARIDLVITGNAFLRNMVRIMAGTLSEVGHGRRKPADILDILEARERSEAGITAPARGLTLEKVHFEGYPRVGKSEGWDVPSPADVDDPEPAQ